MSPSPAPAQSHSPPSTNGELFQHGLHHLLQHNSNTSYPSEYVDEAVHLESHYSPPTPTHDDAFAYQDSQSRFQYQHQHHDSGLGISYDSPMYTHDLYSTPANSPPPDMLRTGSGMTIQRGPQALRPMPEARSRNDKSPKPKKAKKEKVKAEKKVAKLDKPLSELTKDWTHVPVVDIEKYVNRSAEQRRKEVDEGKVPGKVKRPMNSFMLYRKAYQNRTKDWCLQNNHQVVSQVCGDSWPLEPEEVKEQFSEWARIERINHQNAHPGYKFSPTKPGTAKASKRKWSEEPLSEESDLDDFEWRDSTGRKAKKHQRIEKQEVHPVNYPSIQNAYSYSREDSMDPMKTSYNRSSYQASNPRRPLPMPYNEIGLRAGEYYQQTIRKHPDLPVVSDVIIKKAPVPGMHSFLGLPGGGHEYDIMNSMHGMPQYQPHPQEGRIDPSLMTQNHAVYAGNYGEGGSHNVYLTDSQNGQHNNWQSPYAPNEQDSSMPFLDPELNNHESSQIHEPHVHVLKGHQDGWHVETLDGGGEFDKWMDGE